MKIFVVPMLTAALLVGCGGDEDASLGDDSSRSEAAELVQNTREVATMLCEEYGPRRIAKEYGVNNSTDLRAIADAYSLDSTEGAHRAAAFSGCLEGLGRHKGQ